ncbi:MAG: YdeI/OmpD-associated family protein [Proteobacteria bacterium]|nr:YdeI/OmpD-associated family protein [Pseudomonadota bacterium]MDA1133071.1 YdeI/OmpD-associated family protein [Pseudomonadota bacterium]
MQTLTVHSAEDFGKWLAANHAMESKVALALHKRHTGVDAPTHRQLIDEAICWGWIDTTIKRLDDDRYIRHFSRRTGNSKWSDNTLTYAKQLVKAGRMQPEGLKFYRQGLKKPTHDDGIPANPDMPEELRAALGLKKNAKARAAFESYPPSTKKMLYRWILRGKRPTTRTKRVQQIIDGARDGVRNVIAAGVDRRGDL